MTLKKVAVREKLFASFECLRPPKADTFASSIVFNEVYSGDFERSTDGRFVWQRKWDLPLNYFNPSDRRHAYL